LHRQIKNQQDFIKEQNQEKDEVRASYTKDINRYKELKSGPMPAENN
jgi:hypothetical protein